MMLALLLAAACGPGRDAVAAGFAPHLARLDRDGSGGLSDAEYTPYAGGGPAFAAVDTSGDGSIDARELAALVRGRDPVYFDGQQTFAVSGTRALQERAATRPGVYERRLLHELLTFQAEEIAARGGVPPRAEALAAAADTGSLDSAAARTVLAAMAAEAARVGLRWPARLDPRPAATPALATPPLPAVDSGR
jgi:hypothetical protein